MLRVRQKRLFKRLILLALCCIFAGVLLYQMLHTTDTSTAFPSENAALIKALENMSPEERKALQKRLEGLSETEKQRLKNRYQDLAEEEKKQILEKIKTDTK